MIDTDHSHEEAYFIKTVFYALIYNVVTELTVRLNTVKKLAENFNFFMEISHNV